MGASRFFELGKEFLRRLNRTGKNFGKEKSVEKMVVKRLGWAVFFVSQNEKGDVRQGKKGKSWKKVLRNKNWFEDEERNEIDDNTQKQDRLFPKRVAVDEKGKEKVGN